MLFVCRDHVKEGLKGMDAPHVKELKYSTSLCSICNKQAEVYKKIRNSLNIINHQDCKK